MSAFLTAAAFLVLVLVGAFGSTRAGWGYWGWSPAAAVALVLIVLLLLGRLH